MAQSYGYTSYYKPPKPQKVASLATAAAGKPKANDPFGLLTDTTDSARVAQQAPTTHASGVTVIQPRTTPGVSTNTGTPGSPSVTPAPAAAPAAPKAYDIYTDPALQLTTALTGLSDDQARAAALQQKQDQLLAYGDPNLIKQVLGDDTLATAAAANPSSTLAQFGQQRERNVHDSTEGYNKANLLYSGARVVGEEQDTQDYQNALAQAAAGVNSNLGSIDTGLAGALGQTQQQRLAAMNDAYSRHATDPGAAAADDTGGIDTSGFTDDPAGGSDIGGALTAPDFLSALALAAARRRSVAQ